MYKSSEFVKGNEYSIVLDWLVWLILPLLFEGTLLIFHFAKWWELHYRKDVCYGCGVPCQGRVHLKDKGCITMTHLWVGTEVCTPTYTKCSAEGRQIYPGTCWARSHNSCQCHLLGGLETSCRWQWWPCWPPVYSGQDRFYPVLCHNNFSCVQWAAQKYFPGPWERHRWALKSYLKCFQELMWIFWVSIWRYVRKKGESYSSAVLKQSKHWELKCCTLVSEKY